MQPPQPYSMLIHDLSGVVGRECVRQLEAYTPRPPDILVARHGNSADAIGFLTPFLPQQGIRLVCVQTRSEFSPEASSQRGVERFKENIDDPRRSSLTEQQRRIAQGMLANQEYPSVSREHAALKASGRIDYVEVADAVARKAIADCGRLEGYLPPIETSQVIAWACETARTMPQEQVIVVMVAEDADRDLWDISKALAIS